MKYLCEAVKNFYGWKPENEFDILLDSTDFGDWHNPAGHVGWHTDILECYAKNKVIVHWWENLVNGISLIDPNKEVVRVLICCPSGATRSVAAAEILKYIVQDCGKVVKENRHLTQFRWDCHLSTCTECRQHRNQRRFKEALDTATDFIVSMR